MSTQSLQWIRLMKFLEELKKAHYPTVNTMLELLRRVDIDEGIPCACSERTFRRDIDILKKDFHAPLVFDRKHRGYALTDPTWQFTIPVFAPPPKVKAHVNPKILHVLFEANHAKKVVRLLYTRPNKAALLRDFEPHIITLYHGIWYVRGIDRALNECRTYAIQRISKLKILHTTFVLNQKLVEETKLYGPFNIEKLSDIVIEATPGSAFYFKERASANDFKLLEEKADGTLLVQLPPMTELEAIRFVLGGLGEVRILHPESLRKATLESAQALVAQHENDPEKHR